MVLALGEGLPGAWALLLPHRFYDAFPLPGHPWVALFPPYNEHLVRDFGGAVLALAVVLGLAACVPQPWLVRGAAVGLLAFSAPHLVYHGAHFGRSSAAEVPTQAVSLALPLVLAGIALATTAPKTPVTPKTPVPPKERGLTMPPTVQEERLQRRFELWDRDGDGRIDRGDWEHEARRILASFDESPTSDKGQALLDAYLGMWNYLAGHAELGPNGSLDRQAFQDLADRQILARGQSGFDEVVRPTITSILDLCDKDGDGHVSPREFRLWIRATGADESTADTAFRAIDANDDGQLSVEELVQAVHKYHAGELDIALL
ncbi:Ca2+-binding EF-hand superfamily protein [Streptomyces sp. B3I7]|uniref:EF-hand domain-containing protein n=1 Tax=Streptomyces sp. B3I7 TaxID=3042269 RepID=UPI0027859EC0|nr:EF-hand domain-containing protein [Streptomyces sp. B3I7]MDQ0809021.1 Ca2+-binding EF-hand superfamily protein [Streptomyces sp. B3I7]